MKIARKMDSIFVTLCLLLFFIISLNSIVAAQAAPPVAPQNKSGNIADNLSFAASTYKNAFIVGEPVYLRFEMKNMTKEKFTFRSSIAFTQDLLILIQYKEQEPVRYFGIYKPGNQYLGASSDMVPGVIYPWENRICYDSKKSSGYIFDSPGEYTIFITMRGQINYKDEIIKPVPPIKIKVNNPEGTDAKALPMILNPDCMMAFSMLRADEKSAPVLEKFLKQYPDSTYIPFAAYSLIEYNASLNAKTRKQGVENSIAGYKDFLNKYPKSSLADTAMHTIALYYFYLEEYDLATQGLEKLKKAFPNSVYSSKTDDLEKKIILKKMKLSRIENKKPLSEKQILEKPNASAAPQKQQK